MKACSKCKESKNKNEFYANNKVKSGLTAVCKNCICFIYKTKREERTEEIKEEIKEGRRKSYKERTKEKIEKEKTHRKIKSNSRTKEEVQKDKRYHREWYKLNANKEKEKDRIEYDKNGELIRKRVGVYRKNNLGKTNALSAKRKAAKKQALPKKLSKQRLKEIEVFYVKAKELEKETGIKHQVHHIVPLQALDKTVCGLHVPWNLEVLTEEEHWNKHRDLNKSK